jgi:hypothetical protein
MTLVKVTGGFLEFESAVPGVPTHPIANPPPGIWGPTDPRPSQPIYWPSLDPHPEHPIVLPPDGTTPPTGPLPRAIEWHTVWVQDVGWAVIGVPTGAHPTPSRG